MDAPLCSFVGSCFLKKLRSLVLVRSRELEVERAGSAQLQELDLNLADSATDLEDGRFLDACPLEEADHPQGCLVESVLSVSLCGSMRHPLGEEAITTPWIAATGASSGSLK